MIDARRLRILEALDRLGTLTAVAEELHVTGPGLSMQLATLERELGLVLTERQGRRLALTPAGRVLAHHGRDVVDLLTLAQLEAEALRRGRSGTYRVAAFPSACRTFLADTWAALLATGSGIDLQVTALEPDEALAALNTGRAELALIHSYTNVPRRLPQAISTETIVAEEVRLAIRTDDPAAADPIDLADLEGHAWIVPEQLSTCFEMVERACGIAGFRPRTVGESADFAAQLAFVAAGAGVALIPQLAVAEIPDGVTLAALTAPVQRHTIAARRASMKGDAALDRVVDLLRDHAGRRVGPSTPIRRGGSAGRVLAASATGAPDESSNLPGWRVDASG